MKTKLIIVALLGLASILRSQNWNLTGGGTNDIYFGTANASVAIGPPGFTNPVYRFDVVEDDNTGSGSTGLTAGHFEYISAGSVSDATAIVGYANGTGNASVKNSVGVEGKAESALPNIANSFNYGVNGIALGGIKNHGGHFIGSGSTGSGSTAENVGVYGEAGSTGADINAAVYGYDGALTPPAPPAILRAGLFRGETEIQETFTGDASLYLNNVGAVSSWGLHSVAAAHFEIKENGTSRVYISGGGGTAGQVGIGTTNPSAQLQVNENTSSGLIAGIFDVTKSSSAGTATAVIGRASLGTFAGSNGIGVFGTSTGGAVTNTGVHGAALSSGSGNNIGVFGTSPAGTNDYAGFFNGKVMVTGNLLVTSDRKLKADIRPLDNASAKIMLLKPSSYTYKTEEFKAMNLPQGPQMGLIAQELEQVFPGLVSEVKGYTLPGVNGERAQEVSAYKTVNYLGLITLLIASAQEQQLRIEKLEEQLSASTAQTGLITPGIETNLSGMEQNIPNPFSHEAVIKYNLPAETGSASICVYDLTGKQLANMPLKEMGASSLTVSSENFAAGIYIYSIIADGKLIDSKRMIVAEK